MTTFAMLNDGTVECHREIRDWMVKSALKMEFFIDGQLTVPKGHWVVKEAERFTASSYCPVNARILHSVKSPKCESEYKRPGGRQRGDRIVRCHLERGHSGHHEEADTEVTW